jgi:hypothetical protein
MKRLVTLLFQFSRPLLMWNMLCTFLCLFLTYKNGFSIIGICIIIKGISYALAFGYQYYMAANSYFYFRNAGYSVRRLYGYVFAADLLFYIILVTLLCLCSLWIYST